jgi:hypothetical protein
MDAPDTSHPYYWSGFAIIGDGSAAVIPAAKQADAKAAIGAVAANRN